MHDRENGYCIRFDDVENTIRKTTNKNSPQRTVYFLKEFRFPRDKSHCLIDRNYKPNTKARHFLHTIQKPL